MEKHIVLWKLKPRAQGRTKEENAAMIKEKLEALVGQIPEIISLYVGRDPENAQFDLGLVAEFADRTAMQRYSAHPLHQQCIPFVQSVTDACLHFDCEV